MSKKNKYDFYPFNHENLVWSEKNKAILKCKNPLYDLYMKNKINMKFPEYYYCGYVLFGKNNLPKSWRKGNYHIDYLNMLMIHGGLTFGEQIKNYVVFGFDTNHVGDEKNNNLQHLDYIIKITEQMEDQIKIHAKNIKKYRNLKSTHDKLKYIDKIRDKANYMVAPNFIGMLCL